MLLTRRSPSPSTAHAAPSLSSGMVASLARGVTRAIPTMDRRAFLRRSGMGLGAGLAASQLTLVKKAQAADK
ncbi:MAG: twin-arginine translocation signal domain-containing protein, partial [Rubrivivax sp.]